MKTFTTFVAVHLSAVLLLAIQQAAAITINTVPVGNVDNANDPSDGDSRTSGIQNYGAVAYNYRIGTTEVTVGQYTTFLNAVAATDTYALYDTFMATDLNSAGISRSGSSGSYTYNAIGSANRPVTFVSWGDAARFSNWLHNNQPTGLQTASTTERGAYTLDGATTQAALMAISRNAGARWFIPSENEWYKAAYHQPAAQGGDADNYWAYPTRTNSEPYSDQPPGSSAPTPTNTANFFKNDSVANGYNDGFAVTGSPNYSSNQNYLANVGAYAFSASHYGTFDQVGNVWEWNEGVVELETGPPGPFRDIRGGSWDSNPDGLLASVREYTVLGPAGNGPTVGFRVATVPEPNMVLLTIAAVAILLAVRHKPAGTVSSLASARPFSTQPNAGSLSVRGSSAEKRHGNRES